MKEEILQRAKGVRDFGPSEKIERDRIVNTLTAVFELFGYSPIETPVIERYDLFASKFGSGEQSDAMRETFKLKDQGGRDLVLRNEFTVPFARFVGSNPNLKMPFKRYQIGQVFRDGPMKLGRYREFWQCDVDVVGIKDMAIDAELIRLAQNVFEKLNFDVEILINNRKILNAILQKFGVKSNDQTDVLIAIDKIEKIGKAGVVKELSEKGIDPDALNNIIELTFHKPKNTSRFKEIINYTPADGEGEVNIFILNRRKK